MESVVQVGNCNQSMIYLVLIAQFKRISWGTTFQTINLIYLLPFFFFSFIVHVNIFFVFSYRVNLSWWKTKLEMNKARNEGSF